MKTILKILKQFFCWHDPIFYHDITYKVCYKCDKLVKNKNKKRVKRWL